MEIKVGDKVRVSKDAPRIYTQTCIYPSVHNADFEIMDIEDGCANIKNTESFITTEYVIPLKYLIKVEDEAKEPSDIAKEVANNLSNVLEGCCNAINNIANNFDWDAYTADLAHDIAVKIVNKNMGSDPEKVGEYAVKVAKSVVEELKRK